GVGRRRQLRLGEPDCGEDPPDWPEKSPCHPPKGPCKPMGPPGYPAKPKPERKPFCAKHDPNASFLGPLFKLSAATLRSFPARCQYSLGSSILAGCNRAPLSRIPDARLDSARNFSALSSAYQAWPTRRPRSIFHACKELTRYLRQDSTLMAKTGGKKTSRSKVSPENYSSSELADESGKLRRSVPCREASRRRKPCPPPEKCTPPKCTPPCCRPRPLNTKCRDMPRAPCPPPCPIPCPVEKKPPPPKICYRKCPLPPKPPKPPKCPKIPAPPLPPIPPKPPKLPRCPLPCAPPPPPPLPKCPSVPKCPACPPQRECPPPPPCEPCPCPPPCPPPFCPPPPPCPPCPPPIPCPRPLPCPPPPPPRLCPPCPPCPEYPKPPPCPLPPPCCPCPCPEPPPPCPCPKPCPPCPKARASCPKDVPSCPPCSKDPGRSAKRRKMSTYHAPSRFHPLKIGNRGLHVCSTLMGKSSKSSKPSKTAKSSKPAKPPTCKAMGDICKDQSDSCVKVCDKQPKRDKKKDPCRGRTMKKIDRKKKGKKEDCIETCIPKNKCDMPDVPKPPKMEYGPATCPPPKFVSPTPCPEQQETTMPCVEIRPISKSKKEVCPPPPLPKPPTEAVVLCPCPPPPKLHPGPCPCYDTRAERLDQALMPPCQLKEKYVCPREAHYCPQESLVCKRRKPCDPDRKKKRKK
ncbi:PREDICTED: extensin-like, partial [Eufriesea mexicana]|uniref:extensin-like n=1 Tax=Eufriesea mexicana TaxID=516756 RepID=UPI00083C1029